MPNEAKWVHQTKGSDERPLSLRLYLLSSVSLIFSNLICLIKFTLNSDLFATHSQSIPSQTCQAIRRQLYNLCLDFWPAIAIIHAKVMITDNTVVRWTVRTHRTAPINCVGKPWSSPIDSSAQNKFAD